MADDIVTRLRDYACRGAVYATNDMASDAADEIEGLRSALDAEGNDANLLMLEIERLRAALAIASGMISTMPQYEHEHPESIMEMLVEEARRG